MSQLDRSRPPDDPIEGPFTFVSYARKDRDRVYPEVERLERAGFRVWCDRWDIPTASDWRGEIDDAIRDCDCFLIFLSEAAASSDYVRKEVDLALESGKVIVAVSLEKLDLLEEFGGRIGHIQGIEFFALRRSEYEENLRAALFDCVGPPPRPGDAAGRTREMAEIRLELPEPVVSPPVLPKVVFFGLLVSSAFVGLLAVPAFVTSAGPETASSLLGRRDLLIAGSALAAFAGALAEAAFAVRRLFPPEEVRAPNSVLPNLAFSGLLVTSECFGLIAVFSAIMSNFPMQEQDPHVSRLFGSQGRDLYQLVGYLMGLLFAGLSAGSAAGAFAVRRLYLRRRDG